MVNVLNKKYPIVLFFICFFLFFWFYFQPQAIVVPHHNIVSNIRAKYFQKIRFLRPVTKKIIIIGPDHFSTNQKIISYSDIDWSLSNGTIKYDSGFDSSGLSANTNLIKNDHAIYNLLFEIKKYFPQASMVPILIGQDLSIADLDILKSKINNFCHLDCLLIGSIDFSHYLPASLAEVHDAYTLDALNNLNLNKIFSSEVDSPQSLYLISNFAKSNNLSFNLHQYTNSGFILKNPDIETTTHIFGSFQKKFFHLPGSVITTVDLPYTIDQSQNKNSLGIRFFYGVDDLKVVSNSNDFVVATIKTKNSTTTSYFPVERHDSQVTFICGAKKSTLIKSYFDTIKSANIKKDYFWGKLVE